jgi:hypothetical protein
MVTFFRNRIKSCFGQHPQDRRLHLGLIIATLLYCPLLFTGLDSYGRRDWDQFTFRYETPRAALLRDHQLPLWNPYVNGGTVLLAHPDSPFPSPWYLLVLALGAPLGLRVQVVLFMALGSTGMATLLRRWNVPRPGCFVGGVIFMMSAHFALHIAEGHLEWCVLGLMPWLMLSMRRFDTDLRFVIVSAFLLSSVLLFGSVYIMAVYIPFLSVWVLLQSLRQRSWRFAFRWAGTLVLTILLSAVKLLPQLDFVQATPRQVAVEGFSLAGLVPMFLDPRQALLYEATRDISGVLQTRHRGISNEFPKSLAENISIPIDAQLKNLGFDWQWHEYGGYMTHLGLILIICGLFVSWRSQWPLYVAGLLALITVLGNGFPIDLWALLQKLPLYHSLQVPSRFLAAVVFVLAVAAGQGLGWLCQRSLLTRRRSLLALIWYGVPLAIYVELAVLGWKLFGDVFICTPIQLPHYQNFALRYTQINTYFPTMYSYVYPLIAANSGVLEGYENIQLKRGKVQTVDDPDYKGEAYLETSGDPASIREWTMARVKIAFYANKPDKLVLNQNYFTGWRASIHGSNGSRQQPAVDNGSGLVSIEVNPGDREVEFYYFPTSFITGAWISGITLAICLALLIVSNKRRLTSQHVVHSREFV